MGEEGVDLLLRQLARMALAVKEDEAPPPVAVGLLGAAAHVAGTDDGPQPVEKTRFGAGRWVGGQCGSHGGSLRGWLTAALAECKQRRHLLKTDSAITALQATAADQGWPLHSPIGRAEPSPDLPNPACPSRRRELRLLLQVPTAALAPGAPALRSPRRSALGQQCFRPTKTPRQARGFVVRKRGSQARLAGQGDTPGPRSQTREETRGLGKRGKAPHCGSALPERNEPPGGPGGLPLASSPRALERGFL
jgi:hypothetical protein